MLVLWYAFFISLTQKVVMLRCQRDTNHSKSARLLIHILYNIYTASLPMTCVYHRPTLQVYEYDMCISQAYTLPMTGVYHIITPYFTFDQYIIYNMPTLPMTCVYNIKSLVYIWSVYVTSLLYLWPVTNLCISQSYSISREPMWLQTRAWYSWHGVRGLPTPEEMPGAELPTLHNLCWPRPSTVSRDGLWKIMSIFDCPHCFIHMVHTWWWGLFRCLPCHQWSQKSGVLAPTLFSIMFTAMLTGAFHDSEAGIKIATKSMGNCSINDDSRQSPRWRRLYWGISFLLTIAFWMQTSKPEMQTRHGQTLLCMRQLWQYQDQSHAPASSKQALFIYIFIYWRLIAKPTAQVTSGFVCLFIEGL